MSAPVLVQSLLDLAAYVRPIDERRGVDTELLRRRQEELEKQLLEEIAERPARRQPQ